MHSKEFSSVIFSAKIFVASVCALLLTLSVWSNWSAREDELNQAEGTASNTSRALAQHAEDTFKEAEVVLVGISDRLEFDGRSTVALARLERFVRMQARQLPQLNGLIVIDQKGKWIVNSEKNLDPTFSSVDREYFIYHRTHPDKLMHIGPAIRSRATGEWVITISQRLSAPDGSFDGVVLAAIDLSYFRKFYDSFDIGAKGALLLALDNGTMLVRRPLLSDSIGKSMVDTPIFRDYASKYADGVALIRSRQDGVTRINSYRHLSRYPLFVSAALSQREILAKWQADALLHFSGLLVLLMLLGFFGSRLVLQITMRVKAEHEANENRVQIEHLNETLQALAMQDGLTGLANRRCFDDEIVRELRRAVRSGQALSLIMIDVDFFKRYNDTYGHLAGDECLRELAATVKVAGHRPGDMVARYGGEEIVVLLPGCAAVAAVEIAKKILAAIEALAIVHSGNPAGVVTASAGVGVLENVANDAVPEAIIDMADKALYEAKSSGRNRVCLYTRQLS